MTATATVQAGFTTCARKNEADGSLTPDKISVKLPHPMAVFPYKWGTNTFGKGSPDAPCRVRPSAHAGRKKLLKPDDSHPDGKMPRF